MNSSSWWFCSCLSTSRRIWHEFRNLWCFQFIF